MLKERDVFAAYEQLLKRSPEDNAVVKSHMGKSDNIEQLIEKIFLCDEFKKRFPDIDAQEFLNLIRNTVHYQPVYGMPLITQGDYSRVCFDRAFLIDRSLSGSPNNISILDIGCNIGYFSLYYAARGARVHGVDMDANSISLASNLSKFHGIPCRFSSSLFDENLIERTGPLQYDVVFLMSVLHHIIIKRGLEYSAGLLQKIVDRAAIVFFEIGSNDENHNEPWLDGAVKSGREVLNLLKNCSIQYLGSTSAMSGGSKRELFRIDRDYACSSLRPEQYDQPIVTTFSHNDANVMHRFYQRSKFFTKIYKFQEVNKDEYILTLRELNASRVLEPTGLVPKLLGWEVNSTYSVLSYEKMQGVNLSDAIDANQVVEDSVKVRVFEKTIELIKALRSAGLYWNDLRIHNVIICDDGDIRFVDFETTSSTELEDTINILSLYLIELNFGGNIMINGAMKRGDFRKFIRPKMCHSLFIEGLRPYAELIEKSSDIDDFLSRLDAVPEA